MSILERALGHERFSALQPSVRRHYDLRSDSDALVMRTLGIPAAEVAAAASVWDALTRMSFWWARRSTVLSGRSDGTIADDSAGAVLAAHPSDPARLQLRRPAVRLGLAPSVTAEGALTLTATELQVAVFGVVLPVPMFLVPGCALRITEAEVAEEEGAAASEPASSVSSTPVEITVSAAHPLCGVVLSFAATYRMVCARIA